MRVLLLTGSASPEREICLRSAASIKGALEELGYDYLVADPLDDSFDLQLLTKNMDVVFIAIHGTHGEDGEFQEQLEKLNVPFVGSDSQASKLCIDKWAYKKVLLENNIRVPAGEIVSYSNHKSELFKRPYVLKPVDSGSSVDTQVVRVPSEVTFQESLILLSKYRSMLLEELIAGNEITVGILGETALPVIEIIPPYGSEFDFENKYNGATQELCPPKNVSKALQERAQELTLQIHQLTGCSDLSRTDFMIDAYDQLYVLETNTIPGLTTVSLYPKMVLQAGMSFTDCIDTLLKQALNRQP